MLKDSNLNQFRTIIREHFGDLANRYGVESLGLFGSRVRGQEHDDSDLDVLVQFRETPTLLRFIQLENELSDLLELRVDLVLLDSLKPSIAESVAAEVVPI